MTPSSPNLYLPVCFNRPQTGVPISTSAGATRSHRLPGTDSSVAGRAGIVSKAGEDCQLVDMRHTGDSKCLLGLVVPVMPTPVFDGEHGSEILGAVICAIVIDVVKVEAFRQWISVFSVPCGARQATEMTLPTPTLRVIRPRSICDLTRAPEKTSGEIAGALSGQGLAQGNELSHHALLYPSPGNIIVMTAHALSSGTWVWSLDGRSESTPARRDRPRREMPAARRERTNSDDHARRG